MSRTHAQRFRYAAAPAILLLCGAGLVVLGPLERHVYNSAPAVPDAVHIHPVTTKNRGTVYLTDAERHLDRVIYAVLGVFAVAGVVTAAELRAKHRQARAEQQKALERFDVGRGGRH